jgi:hypothetical protein
MFGQYGNFMNDPTTQLASQLGQSAIRSGQEYLEQNVGSAPLPALAQGFATDTWR